MYDPRASGSIPFLTIELLDGVTLSSHIEQNGPMPLDLALRSDRQMAGVMAAAHRAGVIHQDFKPNNVILIDSGDGSPLRAVIAISVCA